MEETAVTANLKGTKSRFAEAQRTKVIFKSPYEEESTVDAMERLLQEPELRALAEQTVQAFCFGFSFRAGLEQRSLFEKPVVDAIRVWVGECDLKHDLSSIQMLFLTHWCYQGAGMRKQAEESKKRFDTELQFMRCVPNKSYVWPTLKR